MVIVNPDLTRVGLLNHLAQHELRSRQQLKHTQKCIRDPSARTMHLDYYKRMLPLHRNNHRKWKTWLKIVMD